VKEIPSRAGVSFTARNVDEDDGAYDALVARVRTVPVTIIGAHAVRGATQPRFRARSMNFEAATHSLAQYSPPTRGSTILTLW
jgi:hypothetical protein